MTKSTENGGELRNTLLFGLLLLFFIQILGTWVESIYRISLTRLGPGKELYGGLLLLLPFALFAVRKERERGFLWFAVVVFLAARVLCPYLGAPGRIVVAGVGVSMFLIILAYAFSMPCQRLKGDMGQAVGVAVLLSVALRSWGSSVDISMEGTTEALGWVLALSCLWLFRGAMAEEPADPPPAIGPTLHLTVAIVGLFGNLALICLVFACPLVVCAWTGYGQLEPSGVNASGCVLLPFALTMLLAQKKFMPGKNFWMLWNGLLAIGLVGGLFLGRPTLPQSPEAGNLFANGTALLPKCLLYAALILSPVMIFNARHISSLPPCARPRNAVPAVLIGMGLLLTTTLLLVFTNVWGYVFSGVLLRNRFYLPFLVAGVAMLLPWALPWTKARATSPLPTRFLGSLAMFLVLLGFVGAAAHVPPKAPVGHKRDLTILTYNMQQGSHLNGDRNYGRQLDLLRRLNPDIIGLQESDTARPSGGNADAVRYLAESLGYYAFYGPCSVSGTFGAAILSRYPIKNAHSFFTFSDSDEVGTAAAEIDVDGVTIGAFSNHPSGGKKVMTAHVDALKAEAGKYAHVIAVGDYNFTAREPYFASLSEVLQDSATQLGEAEMNNHGGTSDLAGEIDHIFVSRNFRVLESHYLPPPESETDHPAHWSVLRME